MDIPSDKESIEYLRLLNLPTLERKLEDEEWVIRTFEKGIVERQDEIRKRSELVAKIKQAISEKKQVVVYR